MEHAHVVPIRNRAAGSHRLPFALGLGIGACLRAGAAARPGGASRRCLGWVGAGGSALAGVIGCWAGVTIATSPAVQAQPARRSLSFLAWWLVGWAGAMAAPPWRPTGRRAAQRS